MKHYSDTKIKRQKQLKKFLEKLHWKISEGDYYLYISHKSMIFIEAHIKHISQKWHRHVEITHTFDRTNNGTRKKITQCDCFTMNWTNGSALDQRSTGHIV